MNMCPSNKCKTPPESCLKGQVFFIWTNYPSLETVKDKISLLGGKVEQFFSRDVTTVLVEDNQLVGPELLSPDLTVKSTYVANGTIVTSFPHPSNLSSLPSTSRGYNFLTASSSSKSAYSPYRIICYARQWGIQVLGIYQFLTWIEPQFKIVARQKQRKVTEHVSYLSGCFIKFEGLQKNYRPCYKMFNNDPERLLPLKNANLLLKPEACNLILDKPIASKQLHLTHMDTTVRTVHQVRGANLPLKANDKKPQNNRIKPKEESNYCECCRTHFTDLKQHIKSTKHQNFVSNDKNYESVHNILKMLPTPQDFIEKLQNPSPSSDSLLTNGDAALCVSVANVPETDFPMPLNLQVRKDTITSAVIPLNMHIEKNVIPNNLQVIKEENMPLPLDLHIKKDDIKPETKEIKIDTSLIVNFEQAKSPKEEYSIVGQPKIEVKNESVVENAEANKKEPIDDNEEINGDPLFDRNNTAALAQMCLKNIESYWYDNLPCEMEDMVFDEDIFDFDDGKAKAENESVAPFDENFANSDIAQSPGLAQGISAPNLKAQETENTPILMSNVIDIKSCINTEPSNNQSFPSICKLETATETPTSPQNLVAVNETPPVKDKKPIFSIVSYCADKSGLEPAPSCSNSMPSKNPEPLFSSESSDDDENGNVLISNALHMITNSDSDIKVDKESSEENSIQGPSEVKTVPSSHLSATKVQQKFHEEPAASKKDVSLNRVKVQTEFKESSLPVCDSDISEVKTINAGHGNNMRKVIPPCESKIEYPSHREIHSSEKLISKHLKIPDTNYKIVNTHDYSNSKANYDVLETIPAKISSSSAIIADKRCNLNSSAASNEMHSYNMKIDTDSRKENALIDKIQEQNSSNYKINQIYPVAVNKKVEDVNVLKEKTLCKETLGDIVISMKSRVSGDISVVKDTNVKFVIPKKNVSLREMKYDQNPPEQTFMSATSAPCEKKVGQTDFVPVTVIKNTQLEQDKVHKVVDTPARKFCLKRSDSNSFSSNAISSARKVHTDKSQTVPLRKRPLIKEKKFHKRIKEDVSLHNKYSISETNAKKNIKEQSLTYSVNPCQYSNRTKIYKVGSSSKLSAKSSVSKQTIKIPHKKESSKLRGLPPLWSVSIVPGSGVKLKFTCIDPQKKNPYQFDTDDCSD